MQTRERFGKGDDLSEDGKRRDKVGGSNQNSRLQEIFYYLSEDTKTPLNGKKGFSVRDHKKDYKRKLDDMMDNITGNRLCHTGHISKNTKTRSFLAARGGSDYVSRRIAENFAAHQPTELLFEDSNTSLLEDKTPKSPATSKGTGGLFGKKITSKTKDFPNDFSQGQPESARTNKDSYLNNNPNSQDPADPPNPFLANLPKTQMFSIKFQPVNPSTPELSDSTPDADPPTQTPKKIPMLKVPFDTPPPLTSKITIS
jgi:hypothetical protein